MSKTLRMLTAIALAAMALPAAAGGWPNTPALSKGKLWTSPVPATTESSDGFVQLQGEAMSALGEYRYFPAEEYRGKRGFAFGTPAALAPKSASTVKDGFEYIGGEAGWQLSQHKYVLSGGKFVHGEECDHVVRLVKAPTAKEIEAARSAYPG